MSDSVRAWRQILVPAPGVGLGTQIQARWSGQPIRRLASAGQSARITTFEEADDTRPQGAQVSTDVLSVPSVPGNVARLEYPGDNCEFSPLVGVTTADGAPRRQWPFRLAQEAERSVEGVDKLPVGWRHLWYRRCASARRRSGMAITFASAPCCNTTGHAETVTGGRDRPSMSQAPLRRMNVPSETHGPTARWPPAVGLPRTAALQALEQRPYDHGPDGTPTPASPNPMVTAPVRPCEVVVTQATRCTRPLRNTMKPIVRGRALVLEDRPTPRMSRSAKPCRRQPDGHAVQSARQAWTNASRRAPCEDQVPATPKRIAEPYGDRDLRGSDTGTALSPHPRGDACLARALLV